MAFATAAAVVVAILLATSGAPATRVVVADQIRNAAPTPTVPKGDHATLPPQPRRVLVVGNSIALYGADEGFKRIHTTPPLDVLNLGSIGCRLLPEETRTRFPHGDTFVGQARVCRDNWAYAVSAFRPDVVVLLVSEPTDAAHEINGSWTAPCEPAYDTVLEHELRDQVRLLGSKGARVVVTTAAYTELPFKSPAWFQHNDCQNAIFRRVATSTPRAVLADLFWWICPDPRPGLQQPDRRRHLAPRRRPFPRRVGADPRDLAHRAGPTPRRVRRRRASRAPRRTRSLCARLAERPVSGRIRQYRPDRLERPESPNRRAPTRTETPPRNSCG